MSNTIKVAVFSGYGGDGVPKEILDKMKCKEMYSAEFRVELAKIIDELPINCFDVNGFVNYYKSMETDNPKVYYIKYLDGTRMRIYLKDCNGYALKYPVEVTICEVDTTKPWRVTEYDGAESIESLNKIRVVDEKYNMCEW